MFKNFLRKGGKNRNFFKSRGSGDTRGGDTHTQIILFILALNRPAEKSVPDRLFHEIFVFVKTLGLPISI